MHFSSWRKHTCLYYFTGFYLLCSLWIINFWFYVRAVILSDFDVKMCSSCVMILSFLLFWWLHSPNYSTYLIKYHPMKSLVNILNVIWLTILDNSLYKIPRCLSIYILYLHNTSLFSGFQKRSWSNGRL